MGNQGIPSVNTSVAVHVSFSDDLPNGAFMEGPLPGPVKAFTPSGCTVAELKGLTMRGLLATLPEATRSVPGNEIRLDEVKLTAPGPRVVKMGKHRGRDILTTYNITRVDHRGGPVADSAILEDGHVYTVICNQATSVGPHPCCIVM